jgi:hypothetical protein
MMKLKMTIKPFINVSERQKKKKKAMLPMEGSQGCEETLWATTAKELWLLVHKSSRNLN